jgi:serine/threonine protein phosphatase PrpC
MQGELAVSRSFGDLHYQPYGLTAEPEVSALHRIGPDDDWLVLASDGIFEVLTPADVCNIVASVSAGPSH